MTNIDKNSSWYLLQLKPNCAAIAHRNLERQGFSSFMPLERKGSRKNGRFGTTTSPYFPGYLFVALDTANGPWRAIRSTRGVAKLVCFGDTPATVPIQVMEILLEKTGKDGVLYLPENVVGGDEVRLTGGPFSGFIGRVQGIAPHQRAWVLLDIMGKATRVSINRKDARVVNALTREKLSQCQHSEAE